jgi:hypothetical protein
VSAFVFVVVFALVLDRDYLGAVPTSLKETFPFQSHLYLHSHLHLHLHLHWHVAIVAILAALKRGVSEP